MQRTADVVYQKLGGEIDLLLMHPSVRREFIKLTEADRRYGPAGSDKPRTRIRARSRSSRAISRSAK
jgi:hypothetical protein